MPDPNPGVSDGLPGDETSSGDSRLANLLAVSGTLVAIATDPKSWLRGHVFELIAEWIVGTVLDGAVYVLGWVAFGFERTASIILGVASVVTDPIGLLADQAVGAIEALYGGVYNVAASAGLAAPLAAAFAVTVLLTVLAVVVFALLKVIPGSDLVEGGLEALRR